MRGFVSGCGFHSGYQCVLVGNMSNYVLWVGICQGQLSPSEAGYPDHYLRQGLCDNRLTDFEIDVTSCYQFTPCEGRMTAFEHGGSLVSCFGI
jgi:hypothetical protein